MTQYKCLNFKARMSGNFLRVNGVILHGTVPPGRSGGQ